MTAPPTKPSYWARASTVAAPLRKACGQPTRSDLNHSRLVSMTYPDGYTVSYNYATGLDDRISRLSSLSDSTGTLESYDYLGLDTVVRRAHPQPGVDLTYIKQSGEADGNAGDKHIGLDRFGRVVDQRWLDTSTGTATDRFGYGYDRDSQRTYRENLVDAVFSELYSYDDLGQLASFDRGQLNGTKDGLTGSASRSQDWTLDALATGRAWTPTAPPRIAPPTPRTSTRRWAARRPPMTPTGT